MKGNARSSPFRLKALVIVVAAAATVSCAKTSDGVCTGCGSPADLASLRERIDTLEAYRARNADFVAKLSASYSHFYYCDATSGHKDPNKCAPMQTHVPPPTPPPK